MTLSMTKIMDSSAALTLTLESTDPLFTNFVMPGKIVDDIYIISNIFLFPFYI